MSIRSALEVMAFWIIRNFHLTADAYPRTAWDKLPKTAAACVGIGTSLDGTSVNSRSGAIVVEAAQLFSHHVVGHVILLGGNTNKNSGYTEAMAMETQLMLAVPSKRRIRSETDKNTRQNAEAALQIATEKGFERVIVIAEAWHARRVQWIFKKVFADSGIELYFKPVLAEYHKDSAGAFTSALGFLFYETFIAIPGSYIKGWL